MKSKQHIYLTDKLKFDARNNVSNFQSETRRTRLLVFLDSHVEVTKGWLEPLIGPIHKGEFIKTP